MSTGFKDWYTRISVSCGQITVAHNSTHVNKPSNVHGRWVPTRGGLRRKSKQSGLCHSSILEEQVSPFAQLSWTGSLSTHCLRATGARVARCQHPGAWRLTCCRSHPKLWLCFLLASWWAWPKDLQSAHVTRGDALLRVRRLNARAAGIQFSTTNGNGVECHYKDVETSSLLLFAEGEVMSNHGICVF